MTAREVDVREKALVSFWLSRMLKLCYRKCQTHLEDSKGKLEYKRYLWKPPNEFEVNKPLRQRRPQENEL